MNLTRFLIQLDHARFQPGSFHKGLKEKVQLIRLAADSPDKVDVYKRQSLYWCAGCVTSPAGHIPFGRSFTCQGTVWHEITNCNHHSGLSLTKQYFCDTMSAVSYTHLDVYKRQLLTCAIVHA